MQNATSSSRRATVLLAIGATCLLASSLHAQSSRRISRPDTIQRVASTPAVHRRVSLPAHACVVSGERAGGRSIAIPGNARRIDRRTLTEFERFGRVDRRTRDFDREVGVIRDDRRTRGRVVGRNERPASNSGFARAQLRFSQAATFTGNQVRVEQAFGRAQLRATEPGAHRPLRGNRGAHGVMRCTPSRR